MKRRLLPSLIIGVFALVGPASLAAAEPATPGTAIDSATHVLAPCIDAAMTSRAQAWVCTPAGLTMSAEADRGRVSQFVPVAPAVPQARTDGSASTQDDYDTWCENGDVCHRPVVANYVNETKGNAAYGNLEGVIGTFDIVLRTNLNGRQAQWRVWLIHETGPELQFSDVRVLCREDVDVLPDINCGVHEAGSPFVNGRWMSGWLYGNRLENSNEYYGAVNGEFTPTGYPGFAMGRLESARFNCYGSLDDRCYFP